MAATTVKEVTAIRHSVNPSPFWGRVRRAVFGIPADATSFSKRGFYQSDDGTPQLEAVGRAFVEGYHFALQDGDCNRLAVKLETVDSALRGFAYEGAAMALELCDLFDPRRSRRVPHFLQTGGAAHCYMVHVGIGWAMARIPWVRRRLESRMKEFDPLLRWLIVDGYGFHEGYFHTQQSVVKQHRPFKLSEYALRVFDQGLGRSLWFVECADIDRLAATISAFPEPRRPDLWSGVGLACAYAGGYASDALPTLKRAAASHQNHVAQGVAFAAKARCRAGNLVEHTEEVCQALLGMSAPDAAHITDAALENLPADDAEPAYEIWRRRIREHLAGYVAGKAEAQ